MSTSSDVVALDEETCVDLCVNPDAVLPLVDQLASDGEAARTAAFFSSMADPTRVKALQALSLADELCVHDLALLVGASESAVSHQLRTLRSAEAVTRRREGRTMLYRLADPHLAEVLRAGFLRAGAEA